MFNPGQQTAKKLDTSSLGAEFPATGDEKRDKVRAEIYTELTKPEYADECLDSKVNPPAKLTEILEEKVRISSDHSPVT